MNVSVIIPAYNAEATLAQTLESLLAQTFSEWEAIVVDDGSTDGTAAVVAGFARRDARIRSVSGPHQGVSAARSAGIASGVEALSACSGDLARDRRSSQIRADAEAHSDQRPLQSQRR